jgi:TonB family protein
MGKLKIAGPMALIIALCSLSLLAKPQDDKDKDKKPKKKIFVDYQLAVLDEAELRHDALTTTMPDYPEEASSAGIQGLVHVAVLYDEDGDFKAMKVLKSPDPRLSQAVATALKQWKLRVFYDSPYPETRLPIRNFAEARFHFVIRDGVPSVEQATQEEQQKSSIEFIKITGPSKDRDKMDWP